MRSAVLLAQLCDDVYVVNACQSCAQSRIAQRSVELAVCLLVSHTASPVWFVVDSPRLTSRPCLETDVPAELHDAMQNRFQDAKPGL